jgi:hypothetical protein
VSSTGSNVRAGPADIETLGLVSTLGYMDAVRRASRPGFRFCVGHGLGTPDDPIFPSMHGGRSADRRGSVAGARAIADGEVDRAVNFYPSLRHAMANHASGFCFHNENEAAQTHRRGAAGRGPQGRPRRRRREPRRADRVLRRPRVPSVCIHQSALSLFHPYTRAATASAFCSLSFNSQNCPLSVVTQHPLLPQRYANWRCRPQES